MNRAVLPVQKRINISLPEETLQLIDRVVEKGDRSRFIDTAVKKFVETRGRARLERLLKEGALKRGGRDLGLAQEWFALEEEAWPKGKK